MSEEIKNEPSVASSEATVPSDLSRVEPQEEAPKPRRRGRKPKAEAEVAGPAPAADEDGKAAPKGRTRSKKAAPAEKADSRTGDPSPEIVQARALARVSQASVVRKQRRKEERAAKMIEGDAPIAAPVIPSTSEGSQIVIPIVDSSLRPHKRGRKPKAYLEAERAAAAAMEAAQKAALDQARAAQIVSEEGREGKVSEPVVEVAPTAGAAVEAPESDNRPGRSQRTSSAKQRRDSAEAIVSEQEVPEKGEDGGQQSRRSHTSRSRDRHAGDDRSEKREERSRNRQQGRNKRNGRFNAPVEPSVSREDLAALKVAELRQKAKELEIDYVGKKKAELVEEIYVTVARAEGFRDIEGILDIANEGFGYIRAHGYMPSRDDAFVPANMIRAAGLRSGDVVSGTLRPSRANDKFPGLAKIKSINGQDPESMKRRPKFSELTPIYPTEPLKMEHGRESITGRAIDIVSPIGKGQRGLIVSPPKAGKTTILKKICQSIAANNPEVHLICLLVDERPEEVTDMERSIKGDVVASTFDMPADNHTRVSELVIERAKRIVEMGGDVVVVLDSITRLARAYNLAAPASGRILSGGVDSAALYPPKRFLGAARNIENGGSLTILASALVDTGSKMDEVIFEEFKGTGNMELKLDRDLADRRIFPAIDPIQSGTRNE
ncbi:MAG: transcription termination factor Rho, partial [Collinsella sp.]|nr:transcription termination factor Rho [Collinsella sp.]